jgi:acyl-CoA thioester hydrolase
VSGTAGDIYQHEVRVTPEMVDRNGHVNNVAYVQWMQDAAVAHARAAGCTQASRELGATWVVRTHQIEYLRPVFAGDSITVLTWVANFRKVRSLRRYKLVRTGDQAVVAEAETDWVFVDASTGRPRPIPEEVRRTLPVVSEGKERT